MTLPKLEQTEPLDDAGESEGEPDARFHPSGGNPHRTFFIVTDAQGQ
jgi:hypothetical protein